jgi:hypothetical protein
MFRWKFPDILVLYINVCGTVACMDCLLCSLDMASNGVIF